jgi:hypothetical protein
MKLYCANCGQPLQLIRKALPKLGAIVDLVSYHECSETPVPFDLSNLPLAGEPIPQVEGKEKFVKSLNDLGPSKPTFVPFERVEGRRPRMTGTDDLRDRRFDQEEKSKSTAPISVIDQIKSMGNSIPAHDLKNDTSESEMGG